MNGTPKFVLPRPVASQPITAQMLWIAGFTIGTVIGARFEIPHEPVPYTLQTLVVLLAGAILGARNGAISQLLYLGAGILGAPVFAGGAFGITKILGPTGGYLLAFPLAAGAVGLLIPRAKSTLTMALSMGTGLAIVFLLGTFHLWAFYIHDAWAAISSGLLIFSWWDLLKLTAATMIYRELARRSRRNLPTQ